MNAATQQQDTSILFPVARYVQGDLYTAQDKDNQGNPLTIKTGDNAGKARVNYFFAIAVPKTPGAPHWAHEQPWGAKIWGLGHAWWPQGQGNNPSFAWKIEDGDSRIPNKAGRVNADTEGFPGHWIVKLGSSFAPKIFDEQGNPLLQPGLIKRGFWVEVLASLASNNNSQNPGIYINHNMVAYRAPGKEIVSGPDPKSVGFGRSALPPGVTAQPMGNVAHMPSTMQVPAPGAAPPPPGGVPAPYVPAAQMPAPAAPVPVPVQPQAAFIQPPPPGAAPPVPGAPVMNAPPPPVTTPAPTFVCPLGAPMGYKMLNLNGPRYDAYRANSWSDPQLLAAGHMVRL